jgi:NDP-sugar pyrophosphorylase family protein
LRINALNKLSGFEEKPEFRFDVSMGIYALNRAVLQYIPADKPYGFDSLMLDLLADAVPASVMKYAGYWLDIGRHEDYLQAIEEFEVLKERFLK